MLISLIYWFLKPLLYFSIASLFVCFLIKLYLGLSKQRCTCKGKLSGKTVVIIGGNAGIGLETAKILAKRGARVVIASRNVAKSQAAVQEIIDASGNPNVECKSVDLTSLASVKRFADDFNANNDRLDVLINNAGFSEFEQVKTEDGIERVMQVNHVAPVYLTNLLLDKIVSSKPSRIIFVSSGAHGSAKLDPEDMVGNKPANVWTRYSNTKLCNILAAKALARRVPDGVAVNSLHPGVANTEIYEHTPWPVRSILHFVIEWFLKTVEECAQTTVHVASAPSLENVSGQYFDNCEISSTYWWAGVTDELADRVWENTVALIEDRTQRFNH